MNYVKSLSLLVVAAAVLMVCAGSASAGNFTNPKNTIWTGEIHAVAGEMTTHGAVTTTCKSSTFQGAVASHGSQVTGQVAINSWTFSECGTNHKTVINNGTLIFHTHPADTAGGTYAIVTSTGLTVTVNTTSIGIHCGYQTNETEIGTFTNSTHRLLTGDPQTTATLHVDAVIPRHSGSIFCGSTSRWTATYEITTPDYLDYD